MRLSYKTTYSMSADAWFRGFPIEFQEERYARENARVLSWPEWWALRGVA